MRASTSKTSENDHFLIEFLLSILHPREESIVNETKSHFPINFLRSSDGEVKTEIQNSSGASYPQNAWLSHGPSLKSGW